MADPKPTASHYADPGWSVSGDIQRTAYVPHSEDNDFVQPGNLYRHVLTETEREHLVTNIVGHLGAVDVQPATQERALKLWHNVDPDLGSRIAKGLGVTSPEAISLGD